MSVSDMRDTLTRISLRSSGLRLLEKKDLAVH
jgi:hypothetical protein